MRQSTINKISDKNDNSLIENKKFRRPNKAVAMRVTDGTLTYLCRKIFNVLMYHTQKIGTPGCNAPSDLPQYKKYYWVPLSVFMDDAQFNSRSTNYLSESFASLLRLKLHCDDEGGVGEESLLAGFRITNRSGKRGDPRWVGWALPPGVEAMAMNPLRYTTASLYYLTALKSSHSLGLYETCKRYATSPGGVTMRKPVAWWHEHLRGVPVGSEMPAYKILKRDVLKNAITEVNLLTDVDVELIEFKNGKNVVELQFRVSEKKQELLLLPPMPMLDTAILARLVLIGFAQCEAEDIMASHPADFVNATLQLVEQRIANTNLSALASPAAFFRAAMKNRYIDTSINVKKAAANKKSKETLSVIEVVAVDPIQDAARATAFAAFDAMDEASREKVLNQAAMEHPMLAGTIRKNPNGKTARSIITALMMTRSPVMAEA